MLGAIGLLAVLRGVVAAATDLTDDEAYYRLWALAPALSYFDHPPMVALLIAAGRGLLGDNPLGIRLGAVLTSLLGPFVLWRTMFLLFGARLALRAVWFALAMPLLTVGGIIITPDTPSVLFWGLAGWAMAELYASRNPNWWLAVCLFAGFGLLSKYTNLFVAAGIVLWLIGVPKNWHSFRSWQLWAGGALAVLLSLPVVIWNANHGWASFAKQFGRVVREQGYAPTYLLELIGGFLALASPVLAVYAIVGSWVVVRSALTRREEPCLLLAVSLVPLLGYFFVHALHARVQANWLAPLYPAFAACAALAATARQDRALLPGAGSALLVGFLLSGLICVHAVFPLALIAKDPSNQIRGWRQLAQDVERLRVAHGACSIATSHYGIAGQLAYHLPRHVPVVPLTEPIRYAHLPPVGEDVLACRALYIDLARRPLPALLAERFGSVVALPPLTRSHHGAALTDYRLALLSHPVLVPGGGLGRGSP